MKELFLVSVLGHYLQGYSLLSGISWLLYEEGFRMREAMNPHLPWDQIHPHLWLQVMVAARPNVGDNSHSGHMIQKSKGSTGPHNAAGYVVQPRLLCWEFNSWGSCSRQNFAYRQECSLCRGLHVVVSCSRYKLRKPQRKSSRRPLNQPPGKGPQLSKAERT